MSTQIGYRIHELGQDGNRSDGIGVFVDSIESLITCLIEELHRQIDPPLSHTFVIQDHRGEKYTDYCMVIFKEADVKIIAFNGRRLPPGLQAAATEEWLKQRRAYIREQALFAGERLNPF